MKWLTFKVQRTPGFRFNLTDLGLILVLFAIATILYILLPESSIFWMPLYFGLSFFLFCNVFRIGNMLEPIRWLLILYRIRKGPYVGVMYYKLNTFQHK